MIDQEFDGPLFKILAQNDTGQAPGHQAGVVIPVPLRFFFPTLPTASPIQPTPSVAIDAILILDDQPPLNVVTTYQMQTWGLTRRETRVTGNLQLIRDPAQAGDLLLIERGQINLKQYRLTVLRQGSALYQAAFARTGSARWGALNGATLVTSEEQLALAVNEIEAQTAGPFEPFEADAQLQSTSKRIARSRAFRNAVLTAYGYRCAMCGGGARSPSGLTEIEAAHVIPRSLKGSDDVRNGIALCRLHHWAFDQRLVGFDVAGLLRVAPAAANIPENAAIAALHGVVPQAPANLTHRVHTEALNWSVAAFDSFWAGQIPPPGSGS